MPEGEPVHVEPPEGRYENNDMVWCVKKRDSERLERCITTLPRRRTAYTLRGSCA